MAAKFIAEQGDIAGQEFSLEDGEEWIIGRDPDQCQVILEDSTISRKHVQCRATPQGIAIENLNSSNPIRVNEEIIEESQILNNGDTVRIGDVLLRFVEAQAEDVVQESEEAAREEVAVKEAPVEDMMEQEPRVEEEEHDTIFADEEEEAALVAQTASTEVVFDPTAGNRFVLKVVAGPNSGAQLGLDESRDYLIGTDANSCDVTFHDLSVSHQHAKLHVDGSSGAFRIEDLNSRNGVFIDGIQIEGDRELGTNEVVALGTSAFVIYDKDTEAQTFVSPLMPIKEKLFKKVEKKPEESTKEEIEEAISKLRNEEAASTGAVSRLIVMAVVTAVLVMGGALVTSLLNVQDVQVNTVDRQTRLDTIMAEYPSVRYTYDKGSANLLLAGHLITKEQEEELLFRLAELDLFITRRIVIDELVRREQNTFLANKYPGVTMTTPEPGRFVLSGFLRTREQMDNLMAQISTDFLYINLLENNVVVEENIREQIDSKLADNTMNAVTVDFNNGEVTLAGTVAFEQGPILTELVKDFAKIPGVTLIRNFVVEASPQEAMINLTGQYSVSGYSERGGTSVNIVINGRILSRGDNIDGLTIQSIRPNRIILEGSDGVKYRIDYNQ